jgi:DNA-binding LacI/PurR family transcriptional regulator
VREILLEEILAGHWQPGERLPSVASLAKLSGLSRWPIQEAFEGLREEGYLRQSERSGTFLETLTPKGQTPRATLGVAMLLSEDRHNWTTTPYSGYRLSRIMAAAEARNYAVEVKHLRAEDHWDRVDRAGAVFDRDVLGVISLYAFPHEPQEYLAPDRLPFVYLGTNTHACLPAVAGDTMGGFYRLTKRILSEGHRDIVCLFDPFDDPWENQSRLQAHRYAMEEAGFEVNVDAFDFSRSLTEGDLAGLRRFIERFHTATAIICMWGSVSSQLVEVAEMMEIRVPQDLSIVAHGASPMGSRRTSVMTHLEYDMDALVASCFDLLQEQKSERRTRRNIILGASRIHEGASLAPPAQGRGSRPKRKTKAAGKGAPSRS